MPTCLAPLTKRGGEGRGGGGEVGGYHVYEVGLQDFNKCTLFVSV